MQTWRVCRKEGEVEISNNFWIPSKSQVTSYSSEPFQVSALFGSTYVCEQLFPKMKHSKSKLRSRLTNKHLQSELAVASSNIKVDICDLMKDKQYQTSQLWVA
jgi:hypothetical protein